MHLALVFLATVECTALYQPRVSPAQLTKDDAAVVRAALDAVAPGKLLVSRLTLPCFDIGTETRLKHAAAAAGLHEALRRRNGPRQQFDALALPPRATRIEPSYFGVREDLGDAAAAVNVALPSYSADGSLAAIAVLTARHEPWGGYTENIGWHLHELLLQRDADVWRVVERAEAAAGPGLTACAPPQPARQVKLSATDLEVIRTALVVAEYGSVLLTHETFGCGDIHPMPSSLPHRDANRLLTRLRARNREVRLLRDRPAHRALQLGPRLDWKRSEELAGVDTAVTIALPAYSDDRRTAMIAMVTAVPRSPDVIYSWHEMLLERERGGWRIASYRRMHMRGGEMF